MNIPAAVRIASVAHAAVGAFRADKKTPYINHPERVATLCFDFVKRCLEVGEISFTVEMSDILVAAWLHDVLEDTKVNRNHLLAWNITYRQLELVELLTKDPNAPTPPGYLIAIAADTEALIIHCADMCANLEDATQELLPEVPETPRRWKNYLERCREELAMFKLFPTLRQELQKRINAMDAELPGALKRRFDAVTVVLQDRIDECQRKKDWITLEGKRPDYTSKRHKLEEMLRRHLLAGPLAA